MYPAHTAAEDNPFISILADGLRRAGLEVTPFTPKATRPQADALHVHWLEQIFWGRWAARWPVISRIIASRLVVAAQQYRAQGKPVVWTVHNLRPHDGMSAMRKVIFDDLVRRFVPLVTDYVVMSSVIQDAVLKAYPALQNARAHLIPHPHFSDFFNNLRPFTDLRVHYGIPKEIPVLASIGKIRAYKGLSHLVDTARQLNSDFRLIIAGDGDAIVCAGIRASMGDDQRFIFDNRPLSQHDVASLLAGSDASVFCFSDILNSGSVLAALSMSSPVICPSIGALAGMGELLGPRWVNTFSPPLTVDKLDACLSGVHLRSGVTCDLSANDPMLVGSMHARIYSSQREEQAR